MSKFTGRMARHLLALAAAASLATAAQAGAIITFGNTSLGINDSGELNFNGVGVARTDVGDAIIPGCPCEGWGVALTSDTGTFATFANQSAGSGGFSTATGANSFGATASTATSVATMADLPVTIRHAYGPSLVADVFQVQVTITNNGSNALNDLVYRRAMDWDVPPTEFREYVTHNGVVANLESAGGNVRYAGNNGFASSDPRQSAIWSDSIQPTWTGGTVDTTNTDFNKAGPADHGSVFDFAFGTLAAGSSRVFNIYYGSAANEAAAVSAAARLGVNVYSLGQSSDPADNGGEGGGDEGGGPIDGGEPTLAAIAAAPLAATPGFDPGNQATFLFAFGGVGGVATGSTPETALLPFVAADGQYFFDAPAPRQWYDPPFATGYLITVTGGDMKEIIAPEGFSDLTITLADGTVLDTDFDGGETFTFGAGVRSFRVTGFLVDTAAARPFPLFMDFESSVTGMTWTPELAPVPEASTLGMMLAGIAAMAGVTSRRRRQA